MRRIYDLQPGLVVQGGADAVREFYDAVAKGCDESVIIVNCARRSGEASIQLFGDAGCRIMWLPMSEENKQAACKQYLGTHAADLLHSLQAGSTVVVNCQEGVHRSVEFTRQLLHMCERSSPWCRASVAAGTPCTSCKADDMPDRHNLLAAIPATVPEEGEIEERE
mmetsp:Transcript_14234/g.19231  ORF Transcript_14234/g.19231 Transcript_14234/m.19231 type:complete len:166 (+) Transcript_14234:3-500(+)